MSFIQIWFLVAGAALMLVPLILHLLQRRKRKLVELSTFRFLFETYFREGRAMKIIEYLLLILRMLILLLLGFFFARPSLTPSSLFSFGSEPRSLVLIIDSSASMSATEGGISRLELAKNLAREFIGRCRATDELALINAHNEAEVLVAGVRGDLPLVTSKIDMIRPTPRTGQLGPGLARAASLLKQTSLRRKEIYLLSDLQRSTWEQYPHESEQAMLERDMTLTLVQIGDQPIANCAVIPEPLPNARPSVNIPVEVHARIANFGLERRDVMLTVTRGGRENEAAAPLLRERLSLAPGEQRPVAVLPVFDQPGFHTIEFQIGGDSFTADDHATVTVPVATPARVLIVSGRKGVRKSDDASFYIAHALQPDPAGNDPRRIMIQQTICEPASLVPGLAGSDVVILANVPDLLPTQVLELKRFVAQGGGLLLMPGDRIDPEFYRKLNSASNDLNGALSPAIPHRTFSGNDNPLAYTYLANIDFQHPVFHLFRGEYAAGLTLPRFYRIWELGNAGPGSRRIASFSIGLDAVIEKHYGKGRVLLTAFPAEVGWNSFPLKAAFVPFLHQCVAALCKPTWSEHVSDQAIDQALTVSLLPEQRKAELSLVAPGGQRTTLSWQSRSDGYQASTNLTELGRYQAELKQANSKTESAWFSTHIDARESLFERAGKDLAQRNLPQVKVRLVEAGANMAQAAERLTAGRPIWRLLVWLAILVMLGEMILANRTFLSGPLQRGREALRQLMAARLRRRG